MKHSKIKEHPLAWRLVWLNLIALALVAILSILGLEGTATGSNLVRNATSIILFAGWILVARFILMATWWPWLGWAMLVLALISTQVWDTGGVVLAIIATCLVLVPRSFRTWRRVSARRRALGFGLGILALVVLFGSTGVWSTEAEDTTWTALDKLGVWSLASLIAFWGLSLFHLAVRMRLHFLRLRPKLAVSAFLIGFVPLVLVLVLGSLIFYSGLGGSRALRATNILESWRDLAAGGNDLVGAPFDTTFCWPEACAELADTSQVRVPAPARLVELGPFMEGLGDTTSWILLDGNIWLMRWEGHPGVDRRARGWLLGERPLKDLSEMVKAGVEVTSLGANASDSGIQISSDVGSEFKSYRGRRVCYRGVSGDTTFWEPWRIFGGSLLPVTHLRRGELDGSALVINLRVGWQDLNREFLEGDGNLNVVAVIVLAVLAFLFLTIELFALFFGIRITEGFVRAVHSLHRGTRALARGELDTEIDIPNEDEFGDLADSFNEMTVAIRQGRQDALAKERLTRELETAREIQERLLPSDEPLLRGFEVTGASIPSREIGGDYFDFLIRDTDKIGVAIGDVSGKGMPAALLMSNLQASLHGQVIHPSSVAEVVGLVNDLIVASTDPHMFATFFYGLLDTTAGSFTCTNAGHNPPMLLRADGTLEEIRTGGLLLGMLADQAYKQETVLLNPGDVVVLYTDGITEAIGPSADEDDIDAMFGEEALEEVIRGHQHLPATGIKEAILDAVARHTEGHAQSDDITLVVIRRQG